jgi:hypothetical protein
VTVVSHPLGAPHHQILRRSRRHLSHPWGLSSHVLGVVTPLTGRPGMPGVMFLFANPASLSIWRASTARLEISVTASTGGFDCSDRARQLPPCSTARMRPSRLPPACRACLAVGAERHPIASLLLHCTTPMYHQYFLHCRMLIWLSLDAPDTAAKPRGLLTTRTHGNDYSDIYRVNRHQ